MPSLHHSAARSRQARQRHGFTLFELLVVIVIIVILASLLLPVINMVRDMAERISCASNLRQCGMTLLLHATDNRGKLPPGHDGPWPYVGGGEWDSMNQYFEHDRSPFYCSSYKTLIKSGAIITPDKPDPRAGGTGDKRYFTYNYFVAKPSSTGLPTIPLMTPLPRVPIRLAAAQGNMLMMSDLLSKGLTEAMWDLYITNNSGGYIPFAGYVGNHGRTFGKPMYVFHQTHPTPNLASLANRFSPETPIGSGCNNLMKDGSVRWKTFTTCQTYKPVSVYAGETLFAYDGND